MVGISKQIKQQDQLNQNRGYLDIASDYGRAGAQGLTLGFADELEAFVKSSLNSKKSYAETIKDVRGKINSFRKRNPAAAYGVEIGASILPAIGAQFIPVAGQAATGARIAQLTKLASKPVSKIVGKNPIRKAAVTGGVQSGIYGAGASEGNIGQRLPDAITAGGLGLAGSAALQKIAPAITKEARQLIKKGIPLTPGQSVRGSSLLGDAFSRLEEGVSGTVPFIGDAIRSAFDRANKGFSRAAVDEAFEDLGVKVPKNLEGRQLIDYGQRYINTKYNKLLSGMSLKGEESFVIDALKVLEDATDDISKDVYGRVDRYILNKFKNDELSGTALKQAQSRLRRDIQRLRKSGIMNELDARKGDALEDVLSVLTTKLYEQNPTKAVNLNKLDQTYGKFEIVRNAALNRKTDSDITPSDLLRAVAKGDVTKRKSQFSAGKARLQNIAETGQKVMGRTVNDSGTAQRSIASQIATGGGVTTGFMAEPVTTGASVGLSSLAYQPGGVPVARNLLNAAGKFAKQTVPVTAAQLPNAVQEQLVRALMGNNNQ